MSIKPIHRNIRDRARDKWDTIRLYMNRKGSTGKLYGQDKVYSEIRNDYTKEYIKKGLSEKEANEKYKRYKYFVSRKDIRDIHRETKSYIKNLKTLVHDKTLGLRVNRRRKLHTKDFSHTLSYEKKYNVVFEFRVRYSNEPQEKPFIRNITVGSKDIQNVDAYYKTAMKAFQEKGYGKVKVEAWSIMDLWKS